ncbi:RING finger and CHY zinc finger domain-containing protein 1 isoform X5 [Mirounga angustirostris]|uniref:RING finger and CHY zinc finger domain-containing protein 1 isoform X5 n=1 Tax=Mirounga angustirostris TaxID=9716 RepID=UPI00313E9221
MAASAWEDGARGQKQGRRGCEHYDRGCLLKAPCCDKLYTCRLCHDNNEDHQLDRFKVKEVQCINCEKIQHAQQTCEECSTLFGEYYCSICHLFDKDKKQYHCENCGICRGYRCPLCMHSALDMTRYWRQLDDEVAQTPMPSEYQNMTVDEDRFKRVFFNSPLASRTQTVTIYLPMCFCSLLLHPFAYFSQRDTVGTDLNSISKCHKKGQHQWKKWIKALDMTEPSRKAALTILKVNNYPKKGEQEQHNPSVAHPFWLNGKAATSELKY